MFIFICLSILVIISIIAAYPITMRLCDKIPFIMMAYPGLENLYRQWYKKNGREYVIEKTSIPAGDRVVMGLCNKIPSLIESSNGVEKYIEWRREFPALRLMYPKLEIYYEIWLRDNNIIESMHQEDVSFSEELSDFVECPNCKTPLIGDEEICPYCNTPLIDISQEAGAQNLFNHIVGTKECLAEPNADFDYSDERRFYTGCVVQNDKGEEVTKTPKVVDNTPETDENQEISNVQQDTIAEQEKQITADEPEIPAEDVSQESETSTNNTTDSPVSHADKLDAQATSEEVSTEEKEQEKKKSKNNGVSCMVCFSILLLVGVMGYFAWSSGYFEPTSEEGLEECDSIAECDSISDNLELLSEEPEFWYDGEMDEFFGDGAFFDVRGHVKRVCYTIIKDGEKAIDEKNFDVNGILKGDDAEYERDIDGRIVGIQNTIHFHYDSLGLLLSETYTRAHYVTEYSLNEYGYRIKWSEYHEDELVESGTFSYISFDSHGNWSECKDSKGNVTKRSFVYWAEDDLEDGQETPELVSLAIERIKKVYDYFVFDTNDDFYVPAYFTPRMVRRLEKEYDYDCPNGGCYASWILRTNYQDGVGESKITDITHEDRNTFVVHYYDMGHKARTRVWVVYHGDEAKIDNVELITTD